ncbi:protein O-mannosyl-transferase TMTC2-like [Schistocerca cancellata]|uniref:protein O-mannosyl-transferase TMTC2-like n=1 Tax=Schistocerca cancellata TaxID=274614 RepID=UPI0021176065|nr:protein O-mannosyl-transferase TMTC2-like [Schistocerca cancellata]
MTSFVLLCRQRVVRGAAGSVLVLVAWLWLALGARALLAGLRAPHFDWSMDAVPRVLSLMDARLPAAAALYASLLRALSASWRKAAPAPPAHRRQRAPPPPPRLQAAASAAAASACAVPTPCPVCRHCTTDQHSAHCRSTNNNNAIAAGAECYCAPRPRPGPRRAHASAPEVLLISLAFLVVPFLPATNLLFYVGFVLAERVLYMPSVGWCLLVALGWHLLAERAGRRLAIACAALLLVALSARTLRRNHDWRDEESLYRSGVAVNPPKAYGNLGAVLSSQGRVDEAEKAFRLALQHRPNMADVHYNLGVLLQGRERYEEAMQSLRLAIQYRPTLAVAHLHLAQLLERQGRCAEAEEQYRRCWEADGSRVRDPRAHEAARIQAMLQLGRLRADQGRLTEAVAAFQAAVRHRPPHFAPQALYNLLGETLVRMRHYEQAEQWFRAALQAEPQHVPAHVTYGSLLAMNRSRAAEAERWFRRALQLAPEDPSVHQHFGQFLSGQQRHAEAALRFEAAADLLPARLDLALAAASSLRVAGLTGRAERFYRRAVQLRPQSARHHLNLGAILHLNGRYDEAAACYREALRLQPDDATALTNLQKLRSLMAARRPSKL